MIETELTRRLGLKYPLIGGAMMSITTPEFVAAVSNAGGLGILASTIYKTPEDFDIALEKTLKLTDKPFAVNLSMFPAIRPVDNNLYLDIMQAKGVGIVETSGHSAPTELSRRFKEADMIWIHKCVGPRYARKVEGLGADFVTVVGYENGGATGNYDIATMVLIPVVKDAVDIPVIGGGGISDGRGISAALCLGACGVIMGTRLLATRECPIHENVKQVLLNTSEIDTRLIELVLAALQAAGDGEADRLRQSLLLPHAERGPLDDGPAVERPPDEQDDHDHAERREDRYDGDHACARHVVPPSCAGGRRGAGPPAQLTPLPSCARTAASSPTCRQAGEARRRGRQPATSS